MKNDFDENRRYMIHCPDCHRDFVWNDYPLYGKIRATTLAYNSVLRKLEEFDKVAGKRNDPQYRKLHHQAMELAADLSDLKRIRMCNRQVTEDGWIAEFKDAVRELVGDEEYNRLIRRVNKRMQPVTPDELIKNRREE